MRKVGDHVTSSGANTFGECQFNVLLLLLFLLNESGVFRHTCHVTVLVLMRGVRTITHAGLLIFKMNAIRIHVCFQNGTVDLLQSRLKAVSAADDCCNCLGLFRSRGKAARVLKIPFWTSCTGQRRSHGML